MVEEVVDLAVSREQFCIYRPKLIYPSSDGFIGNIHAALDHQIFDMAEPQVEVKIHLNGTLDDVWMEAVPGVDRRFHC